MISSVASLSNNWDWFTEVERETRGWGSGQWAEARLCHLAAFANPSHAFPSK